MIETSKYNKELALALDNVGLGHIYPQDLSRILKSHQVVRMVYKRILGIPYAKSEKVVAEIVSEPTCIDAKINGRMHDGLEFIVRNPEDETLIRNVAKKMKEVLGEDVRVIPGYRSL